MNIVEFTEHFFSIEKKYRLFEKVNKDGLLYWDIVRYAVFSSIYNEVSGIKQVTPKKKYLKVSFISLIFLLLNECVFQIKMLFVKYDYFFFISRRYKLSERSVDFAMDDYLKNIEGKIFIIDSFEKYGKPKFGEYFNLQKKIKYKLSKVKTTPYEIAEVLKKEFVCTIDVNKIINSELKAFNIERGVYLKLFKKIFPKAVFINQNGNQKGMISAAKELNIPSIEVQHGAVHTFHPAYSYSSSIPYDKLKTIPDFLFSLSPYWGKSFFCPIKNIISMGNTNFFKISPASIKKGEITIIFADLYTKELLKLTRGLSAKYSGRINVKLHPYQLYELDYIEKAVMDLSNVYVHINETPLNKLLGSSNEVVAVQSTAVYEALQVKCRVMLYKIHNYEVHSDLFGNQNVELFDCVDELISLLGKPFCEDEEYNFFSKFDKYRFNVTLKALSINNAV